MVDLTHINILAELHMEAHAWPEAAAAIAYASRHLTTSDAGLPIDLQVRQGSVPRYLICSAGCLKQRCFATHTGLHSFVRLRMYHSSVGGNTPGAECAKVL